MKEQLKANKLRWIIIAVIIVVVAVIGIGRIKIEPAQPIQVFAKVVVTAPSEGAASEGWAGVAFAEAFKTQYEQVSELEETLLRVAESGDTQLLEELAQEATKDDAKVSDVKELLEERQEEVEQAVATAQANTQQAETNANTNQTGADTSNTNRPNTENSGSNGNSSNTRPQTPNSNQQPQQITVSVSIECYSAIGLIEDQGVAAAQGGGGILGTSVSLPPGSTVYDALTTACRNNGIQYDGSGSYITGINYLYEKALGPEYPFCGWMYYVNGAAPNVGCGSYTLNGGESISWSYVTSPMW